MIFEVGIVKEFKGGWAIDCRKGRQTLVKIYSIFISQNTTKCF